MFVKVSLANGQTIAAPLFSIGSEAKVADLQCFPFSCSLKSRNCKGVVKICDLLGAIKQNIKSGPLYRIYYYYCCYYYIIIENTPQLPT